MTAPMVPELSGAVAVVRGGEVASITGGGCTSASRFQIASISKVFAATLTMLLTEQGRLSPHDPVERWLPDAPPTWRAITLHRLLTHTAGLGHWSDVGVDPIGPTSREERLTATFAATFVDDPGTTWRYSSPGYMVLGAAVERAGGRPYAQLLADHVLRPLDLTATTVGRPLEDAVPGHPEVSEEVWANVSAMVGSGDLWSTVTDVTTFARALGGGEIVTADSLASMRTPYASLPEPDRSPDGRLEVTGYGYGLFLGTFDGRPISLHTGDNPGYRSVVLWGPDDLIAVGLSNDGSIEWDDVLSKLL